MGLDILKIYIKFTAEHLQTEINVASKLIRKLLKFSHKCPQQGRSSQQKNFERA